MGGAPMRWGVTPKVKFFVKYILPIFAADRLRDMREWAHYRRELRKYDREVEALLLDPRFPEYGRRKPLPVPPPTPLKRVYE